MLQNRTYSVFIVVFVLLFFAGAYFIPWRNISWGKLTMNVPAIITVTGEGKIEQASQIASFTAGVSSVNDNRDQAVAEVNDKIRQIIDAVKEFGIPENDIQTQNLSVYQSEEQVYQEGRQVYRPGQWRVNNNIEIVLRDPSRASELADMLTQSGATNVYGPNFRVDDTQPVEDVLLQNAIENARKKARTIASASGRSLGDIVQVQESTTSPVYPVRFEGAGGGGGAPIEPGTSTITKTITVTFEVL